jgi:hypothetical protein
VNEVVPKLLSEREVADIRSAFADVKKNVGVDPASVEYVAIATRFRKPAADLSFVPPEFMVITGGDFSSESLLTLARLGAGGQLRDESYAGKSISLMTIEPIARQIAKTPMLKAYSEIAITALTPNTVAVGSPAYVRAAIDSAAGTGRISPATLNSLLRDPNALLSAAGSPWSSFSKSFGLLGTEATERSSRCDTRLGDFYVAITMDAATFMLRGLINADNPDTAKIVNNLIAGLMAQAASIPDPAAQTALKSVKFTAEDNDVVVRADIPQQMVLDFIKQQTAPKKEVVAVPAKTKKKQPVRRKRRKPTP